MKPLKVAVLVKDKPQARLREARMLGFWSYPVPQFEWEFKSPGKQFVMALLPLKRQGFDLVWVEDGGTWGSFMDTALPVVYQDYDSTLSLDHHLAPRLEQARRASLVVTDHAPLLTFAPAGKPVFRLPHAVNDHIFHDYGCPKTVDVAFHCGGSPDRAALRVKLHHLCRERGWVYASGVLGGVEYAQAMNRAKVVVNLPRVPGNRPHRILDAFACQAAVLTYPIPDGGEFTVPPYYSLLPEQDLGDALESLLAGDWQQRAEWGYREVMQRHTWSQRAKDVRALLSKELGL